jgi:hypothetical protein
MMICVDETDGPSAQRLKAELADKLGFESLAKGAVVVLQRGLASFSAIPPEKRTERCYLESCLTLVALAQVAEGDRDVKTTKTLYEKAIIYSEEYLKGKCPGNVRRHTKKKFGHTKLGRISPVPKSE